MGVEEEIETELARTEYKFLEAASQIWLAAAEKQLCQVWVTETT